MLPADKRSRRQSLRLAFLRLAGRAYAKGTGDGAGRSLLLIRPDHLGDMLFLTPGLRALRAALPAARITLLTGPWSAELAGRLPEVDDVRTLEFPGFERRPKGGELAPYRTLMREAAGLRAGLRAGLSGGYDTSVVLRYDHWWGAWLAAAAGIGVRLGYAWPETLPFLTQPVPYVTDRHEVLQNLALLQQLAPGAEMAAGPLRWSPDPSEREWAAAWLKTANIDPAGPLIAIHPGAGAAVKQWPAACWGEVAAGAIRRHGVRVLVTGSAGESGLADRIVQACGGGAASAAGATTVGRLAALLERCALVLGPDCGPLHLAVAVGRPTIHLFGPSDPAKFGPWGPPDRHRVMQANCSCAPCGRFDWPDCSLEEHNCMASITPARVLAAVEEALGGPPQA